jgi:ABC-type transport system involved in cytochrome c biogenesis permease subunit
MPVAAVALVTQEVPALAVPVAVVLVEQLTARMALPILAVGAAALSLTTRQAQAAAVLSLCALRDLTHLLTVKPQSVEQPREHTRLAALTMLTTLSIRLAR